jgi:hypothetical protein
MAKPRASALKAKPRTSESSEDVASEASKKKKKKKVLAVPKQDVGAAQARERARQRSGADD